MFDGPGAAPRRADWTFLVNISLCAPLVANASNSGVQLLVASPGTCLDSSTRPMLLECPVRQIIHLETPIVLRGMPSSRHWGCVFSCVWHRSCATAPARTWRRASSIARQQDRPPGKPRMSGADLQVQGLNVDLGPGQLAQETEAFV